MYSADGNPHLIDREAPLEIHGEEFRRLGYQLVDRIAEFLDGLPQRPVTIDESPQAMRRLLYPDDLPEHGAPAGDLFREVEDLLFDHSLFNGHPRFWGYITSSGAPIGALADLLAAAVNPNVGASVLSPIASEIEAQTIRWIADLIGYPRTCGGLLVSGGNLANFTCYLAARESRSRRGPEAQRSPRVEGRLVAYVSTETHTWIDKAAELLGSGATMVRWIEADPDQRMNVDALEERITADLAEGHVPFLAVGTAGTVATGATDPLPELAAVCKKYDMWFHVDGAYGAPAVVLPDASGDLTGLRHADSVALDPHKWLYSPLEAGCALVRDPRHLVETFSHHPAYYNFDGEQDESPVNYYEFGLQNSRGFRALKVWLGLRQAGREGYVKMIGDDIDLAKALHEAVEAHPELQAVTRNLSISTFRFVPPDLAGSTSAVEDYLNRLNEELVSRLQKGGEAFVSNAVVAGAYLLRACIVNFRTTLSDVRSLPEIVVVGGRILDSEMRPEELRSR